MIRTPAKKPTACRGLDPRLRFLVFARALGLDGRTGLALLASRRAVGVAVDCRRLLCSRLLLPRSHRRTVVAAPCLLSWGGPLQFPSLLLLVGSARSPLSLLAARVYALVAGSAPTDRGMAPPSSPPTTDRRPVLHLLVYGSGPLFRSFRMAATRAGRSSVRRVPKRRFLRTSKSLWPWKCPAQGVEPTQRFARRDPRRGLTPRPH